jgi:hypothetical protein
VRACNVLDQASGDNAWLSIANKITGYTGYSGWWVAPPLGVVMGRNELRDSPSSVA